MDSDRMYPWYVCTDYDRWIFDQCTDVQEFRNLVNARLVFKRARLYGKSLRMWKYITPLWYSIKAEYLSMGGQLSS